MRDLQDVMIRVVPGGKTLEQLWEENGKKSGFKVMSPTNQTAQYELLTISSSKNLGIVSHRGHGLNYIKKYYHLFVLDNPRWFGV